MRRWIGLTAFILFTLFAIQLSTVPPARATPALKAVHLSAGPLAQYDRLEIILGLDAQYDNPFDPDQIDVSAAFISPQGRTYRTYGFYWRDFRRALQGGREVLTPQGEPAWKVRFTPDSPGLWRYRIAVRDRSGQARRTGIFRVRPARARGFIRRSPNSRYYLRYDDGSPYFVVGEDVGWSGRRGTYDYDDWFSALGKAGGNWARVWLVHWNMGLEWSGPPAKAGARDALIGYHGLGRYALDDAWKIDAVLDRARRSGIGVMLTLGTYSQLKEDTGYFHEEAWKDNPYNARNGGPCRAPADFFTDPQARRFYKRRLRYLAARYGFSTALQSWEFFNETNAPAPWVAEMARALRSLDPYHHLISTTYGDPEVWRLPDIDFTQSHTYGEGGSTIDSGPGIAALNRDNTMAYPKPHLVAEFGIDWQASDRKYDPHGKGINLHNGLWASALSRGTGGAATWWWDDYVHPLHLYPVFTPLARFAARFPWAGREWTYIDADPPQRAGARESWSDVTIPAMFGWGRPPGGAAYTVSAAGQVSGGPTPQFLYSAGKADIRSTPRFTVDYRHPGRFVVHVDQVMTAARLRITVDGGTALDRELPAGPGKGPWKSTEYQPEWKTYKSAYDRDFGVDVPAGRHVIQVENAGGDWMLVSGYRLAGYRSAHYPPLRVMGVRSGRRGAMWVQDEGSTWKAAQEGQAPRTWSGVSLRLKGFTPGAYRIVWWDTWQGKVIRTDRARGLADGLPLRLPAFARDLAADIQPMAGP